ncbi:MAG TPA: 30S ribosomal protein S5 [Thermotogota bacterium]|nr:30S ribosomal protein S5 [Thermotogota bacterium]HRW33489.1 30S ribosomal protein S5 [Thermotogota bacterium]
MPQNRVKTDQVELEERVVDITRTTKVVGGGKNLHFRCVAVVGDRNGTVGIGIGSALEVPDAIRKAISDAKKNLITVPIIKGTIPHEIQSRWTSAEILMKPAAPGAGVVASDSVRAVVELAGVHNILTKNLGSRTPLNVVRATFQGLKELESPVEIAAKRDIKVREVFNGIDRGEKHV